MKGELIKCVRCNGRKKLFKVNSGYSYTNTGGIEVECPMCMGTGTTKSLSDAIEELKKVNNEDKTEKGKVNKKDFKDEKTGEESRR
jgi:hypothetical protein